MKSMTHKEVDLLFKNLETGLAKEFFEQVDEKVHWKVMGTHPLAGDYKTKASFLKATFERLDKVFKEGVILKVKHIVVENNTAVVEMDSLSTANNGEPFNNSYCWVVDFNEDKKINMVRAYVDSALVQEVIDKNELHD